MKKFDFESQRLFTEEEYVDYYSEYIPNKDLLKEQFKDLPVVFDSEVDTLRHIKRLNELLNNAAIELIKRSITHDDSKLESIEKPYFDTIPFKLKTIVYGSEEYKASLAKLKPALDNHYKENSHHPEHYKNGIDGMNLFDLIEMYMDWQAAGERHIGGSMEKSIEINKNRFKMSEQLVNIFLNTHNYLNLINNENSNNSNT